MKLNKSEYQSQFQLYKRVLHELDHNGNLSLLATLYAHNTYNSEFKIKL